jgi:hypothetical protein
VLVSAVRGERDPLPRCLMWAELAAERALGSELIGELRRLLDPSLVELLVLERVVEALDDAVRGRRIGASAGVLEPTAAELPTRRLTTAHHA